MCFESVTVNETVALLWIPDTPSKHWTGGLLHKPANSAVHCTLTLQIDCSGQKKMQSQKHKGSASVAAGSANEKQPNRVNAEMRRAIIALIENDDPHCDNNNRLNQPGNYCQTCR